MKRVLSYAQALARWIAAGRPVRTAAERQSIFETHCRPCEHFVPRGKPGTARGKCGLCGCGLQINSEKVSMATEQCPATPPRWYATAGPLKPNHQHPVTTEPHVSTRQQRREAREARSRARHERAQAREKRKAERQARQAKKRAEREAMGGPEPPLATRPDNADPLEVCDRDGNPTQIFRGWWQGTAAFLVGGGPSLKQIDLGFLKERGIASLGINNVAGYAPVKAMTFSDPPEKFHHGVLLDPAIIKFVPKPKLKQRVRAKLPDGTFKWTAFCVRQCPAVVGYERDGVWRPEEFLTRPAATWGISQKHPENRDRFPGVTMLFTFFLGLRLLHYLGVRRVYLLGVDFGMDQEKHYAFAQYRWQSAIKGNNNTYLRASSMLADLRPHFERAGFQVFQTNKHSGLRVFDHVPLETAIADCRGVVPMEPLDLSQWYEKIKVDANPEPKQPDSEDRGEE